MDTNRPKYRPLFLEHFEKKEVNHLGMGTTNGTLTGPLNFEDLRIGGECAAAEGAGAAPLQRALLEEGNFEFLSFLSEGELEACMARLDAEMEAEIERLHQRYERKRRPILDAISLKRKRQQNF